MKKCPTAPGLMKFDVKLTGDKNAGFEWSEEKATQPPTKCIINGGVECKFVV